MKRYFALALLWLSMIPGQAQGITSATLTWTADACLDVNTGMSSATFDQLVSYGNARIEWRSIQGDLKRSFTILEVNGQWDNVNQAGSILYEVESDGRRGTVQFSRTGGAVTIHIVLLKDEGNAEQYTLLISTITIQ